MSITEEVLDRLKELPEEKQLRVLEFADSLVQRAEPRAPRKSLEGLWRGLMPAPVTEEEIGQARREMWGDFPRELSA